MMEQIDTRQLLLTRMIIIWPVDKLWLDLNNVQEVM